MKSKYNVNTKNFVTIEKRKIKQLFYLFYTEKKNTPPPI